MTSLRDRAHTVRGLLSFSIRGDRQRVKSSANRSGHRIEDRAVTRRSTVYQRALEFASWSQDLIESLTKRTSTRDHLERAGVGIALNIAEGNSNSRRKTGSVFSGLRMVRLSSSSVSGSPCRATLLCR